MLLLPDDATVFHLSNFVSEKSYFHVFIKFVMVNGSENCNTANMSQSEVRTNLNENTPNVDSLNKRGPQIHPKPTQSSQVNRFEMQILSIYQISI